MLLNKVLPKEEQLIFHRIRPIVPVMFSRPFDIIMIYFLGQQFLMQVTVHLQKEIINATINKDLQFAVV